MSAEAPKVYAAGDVIVEVANKTMSGYGDDVFVKITEMNDLADYDVGADGSLVITKNPRAGFIAELTVSQTSDFNDVLDTIVETDYGKPGLTFSQFFVRDLNGRSKHSSKVAVISKKPETEYAKRRKLRMWTVICGLGQNQIRGSKAG